MKEKKKKTVYTYILGFPGGSKSKKSAFNAEDLGSIPGSVRFPGERNGNSLIENPGGLQSIGSHRVGHDRATKMKNKT